MMMNKKEIIEKIKKCLALSQSTNQHEAALALKQAQALMAKYDIDANDADLLGIQDFETDGSGSHRPPKYEVILAQSIAKMMDCKVILTWKLKRTRHGGSKYVTQWTFYGFDPVAEIAGYAFDVLYRKCKSARTEYIQTKLNRVQIRTNKIKRADLFAEGWVLEATQAARKIKPNTEKLKQIEAYTEEKLNLKKFEPTDRNEKTNRNASRSANDFFNGRIAGQNTQINHAMHGTHQEQLQLGVG